MSESKRESVFVRQELIFEMKRMRNNVVIRFRFFRVVVFFSANEYLFVESRLMVSSRFDRRGE